MIDYYRLSKTVSQALRHNPESYDLILDEDGWVDVNKLILALSKKNEWVDLNLLDIEKMIDLSTKKRHEIIQNKIRAIYEHSTPTKIIKKIHSSKLTFSWNFTKQHIQNIQ